MLSKHETQYINNHRIIHWSINEDHRFMVSKKTNNNFHSDVYGIVEVFENEWEAVKYAKRTSM